MKTKFNKKQKNIIYRLAIGVVIFIIGLILPENLVKVGNVDIVQLLINLAACIVISYDLLIKTVKKISKGEFFNEDTLMTIAAIGAFCTGQFEEATEVMLFFQVGALFESYSVSSSRDSVSQLMEMYPEEAVVIRDGKEETVSPEEVEIGETVIVRPGEKIPVDGIVLKGNSAVDTSALTGESAPVNTVENDEILSGSINLSSVLEIKCTKAFEESTVSKILELVENATENKSETEGFVSKFAKYYTPIVVILAVLVAFIPPLISLAIGNPVSFIKWIKRALIFLVVSCPCAIVISVPLAFFGSIGGASRNGILIKGGNFVEALSKAKVAAMDKTGTLTEGVFAVAEVKPVGISEEELIKTAAYVESYSNHPIAHSLKKAYNKEIDKSIIADYTEKAGYGIKAVLDGKEVIAGKWEYMADSGIKCEKSDYVGTVVYLAINNKFAGYIGIRDSIKKNSPDAISKMKSLGVKVCAMLTGDSEKIGAYVAKTLKLDKVYTKLLPGDKVDRMKELKALCSKGETLIFAGDGMNDAPVLSYSDVGIAMGALGSDAAIEAADVVIMDDDPIKIADSIEISKKCMKIVWFNVAFALCIKILVLILATVGVANMVMGIFADVGVSIICILNSMRTLRFTKK
jgi:Cd2+/Zn2+-exporting ATPase